MDTITYQKQISAAGRFDVIVVGAGSAGATAAIASARAGAKTLLIDRLPFLGGTSTAVLDTFYGYYTPGSAAVKVVGGLADDVVTGLNAYNAAFERPNTFGAGTGITYHPEYLKVVWENLVKASGCQVLLNAWVQDVFRENGRITGLLIATKTGLSFFRAAFVIDASGDADVCYYGGFPFELAGETDPAQTLTTTFKMVNVDLAKRRQVAKNDINAMMAEAASGGKYNLPRKEGSDHITPVDHMTATIMTRLKSYESRNGKIINATDPELWSTAEMEGRLQAIEYIRFLKDFVPGYEKAELSTFGFQIGVRETRRITGHYRLTSEDVLSARQFDDQIGLCGAPMEDHHDGADTKWQYLPEGSCVGIPYRTLIPKESENLLVAGRCFSASHVAHSSVRSMAQCMVMGEAAGVAAAMAVNQGQNTAQVDPTVLRKKLTESGAKLNLNG
ncbi:FAD-dependent oxidoreductase [Pedobacter heparinus]|uniref:FAD-dependent oxidoreductase n=1 Tax=Pedobacter heparinus TaxID=984 RepID=UPI002930DED5|nr:FAD-dependent oxidoreductase [Pedobacter heparinus]